MSLFKKKKTFFVKYKDNLDVCSTYVKAYDKEDACREVENRYPYPWYVQEILEIREER